MESKICKHCKREFVGVVGRIFSNHVRWCDKNPNRKQTTEKIAPATKAYWDKEFGEVKDFKVYCHICKKDFLVKERSLQHPVKDKYFCSRSCSNTRERSQDFKDKLRQKVAENIACGKVKIKTKEVRICAFCNKEFFVGKTKIYCNSICAKADCRSQDDFKDYRNRCKFTFNVWEYPEEFDLSLIKKYGWYKASNRGNNLGGVSRDHKISVKFGYDNNISPEILAHPANCQLMVHKENSIKYDNCSVCLDQLKKDIGNWDLKHEQKRSPRIVARTGA